MGNPLVERSGKAKHIVSTILCKDCKYWSRDAYKHEDGIGELRICKLYSGHDKETFVFCDGYEFCSKGEAKD